MASNLLITSLENAFVSLINPVALGLANVYPGHSSATKALPAVIAAADGSSVEEDPPQSGNCWVDFELSVKAAAAAEPGAITDPNVADLMITRLVFNVVKVSNLAELLNMQGQDLTVFPNGCFFSPPKAGRDAEGVWVDMLPIRIYCCASVLAP